MKTLLLFGQLIQALLGNMEAIQSSDLVYHMVLCQQNAPKSIQDLQDGVVIDAYDFFDGEEKALALLGFININIKKQERITVIEYLQKGSSNCNNDVKHYAIGARLLMRVTSHTKKARLDTPQQITASVIFGQATVKFSMHTLGITGPGVAHLNMSGSVTENTYSSFISSISDLLKQAYQGTEHFIICPQLL